MQTKIIDGSAIAAAIKDEVTRDAALFRERTGIVPGLAFLLVGDDAASQSYVRSKGKACEFCGFHSVTVERPASTSEDEVLDIVHAWNADTSIHGILVQLPLPPHINENKVIEAIAPHKDVDGFTPINVGKLVIGQECYFPCTPAGICELLRRSDVETSGKHVVVVGRSNIVGKPVANMLMQKMKGANAIVTVAHSAAKDLAYFTRMADILIVAIGKARAITADMVREGVAVIDVGINRVDDASQPRGYKLVGDVDFEGVKEKASAITPVPKGVGPMTIAMLMKNTLQAAMRSGD